MVDFSKLIKRTPEESQALREEIDREFQARMTSVIEARSKIINECTQKSASLSPWERQFNASLQYLVTSRDRISGLVGGALFGLSDAQASKMTAIHTRISAIHDDPGSGSEGKSSSKYPNRPQYPRSRS